MEHFKQPKLKFFNIERYEEALRNMVRMSGRNKGQSVEETGHQASYKVIKSFAEKYRLTDINSYSRHWQARKKTIVP